MMETVDDLRSQGRKGLMLLELLHLQIKNRNVERGELESFCDGICKEISTEEDELELNAEETKTVEAEIEIVEVVLHQGGGQQWDHVIEQDLQYIQLLCLQDHCRLLRRERISVLERLCTVRDRLDKIKDQILDLQDRIIALQNSTFEQLSTLEKVHTKLTLHNHLSSRRIKDSPKKEEDTRPDRQST